ncbi:Alpha/beta fold hydrolase [Hyphomicrobiales bacterium]|nr:Alpha/beta fold hydrolase [Hyphomicrobiales bacterium]CAH1701250.1 Alpha/beta fold hydrolase [Hyphomicrobiales bacterium]CAI0345213.1 Alpha/beta fold hydrolase [Hyphomicrobiales bacterium]
MKEPLVLVPGLSCNAALYAPQWPALADGRPILVADHSRDDTLSGIARRLLAAAPARFALCGLSMGGYVALEVLRQAPERVTRLALLHTSAKPATAETNAPREQMIALAEKGAFDNVTTLLWQRLVAPARLTHEPLRLLVRRMADDIGADGFVRQQRAIMGRPDSRPSLAESSCPVLVLVGEQDEITPVAEAREMAGLVGARGRLAIIPRSGHLSTLEDPEAVTAELLRWLG